MVKNIFGSKNVRICSAFITQILQKTKTWFLTLFIKIHLHLVRILKAEEYAVASET